MKSNVQVAMETSLPLFSTGVEFFKFLSLKWEHSAAPEKANQLHLFLREVHNFCDELI